jgi:hypothetical protein
MKVLIRIFVIIIFFNSVVVCAKQCYDFHLLVSYMNFLSSLMLHSDLDIILNFVESSTSQITAFIEFAEQHSDDPLVLEVIEKLRCSFEYLNTQSSFENCFCGDPLIDLKRLLQYSSYRHFFSDLVYGIFLFICLYLLK